VRHLARHEIGLVALRHGDQQVGVLDACAGEDRRMRGVAGHRPQVETILQVRETLLVAVDNRDIVVFRNQTLGDTRADLSGAENDDPHFLDPPERQSALHHSRSSPRLPIFRPSWRNFR
jgi:hypothetical protein